MPKSIVSPEVIKITEDFLHKAGLDNMPPSAKADYVEKLGAEIQERIGLIAMQELDEASVRELADLTEKNPNLSQKEIAKFFKAHIVDFDKKITQKLDEFLVKYLEKVKSWKSQ